MVAAVKAVVRVFVKRQAEHGRLAGHFKRRQAPQTVHTVGRNMKDCVSVVLVVVAVAMVDVIDFAAFVALDFNFVRVQNIERSRRKVRVPLYENKGVSFDKQKAHHPLPKGERGVVKIRRLVDQRIERSLVFADAALVRLFVNVARQRGHRVRND